MTRNASFRAKLSSPGLAHAMAAHNPLSARLAERAGFDAIWGSGFELSASYGVPDASLLSMSVHLETMRAIAGAISIPLIADIDTGFGNAVNVSHVVPQFEAAGASAVVMEHKTFPKDTSLRSGARQELVRVEEFQGKVAAACAARRDPDFVVIARVEALIAGLGQAEASRRASAYVEAGADAILIHSKQKTPDEILEFVRAWRGAVPLVLVPTAYPQLTERDIAARWATWAWSSTATTPSAPAWAPCSASSRRSDATAASPRSMPLCRRWRRSSSCRTMPRCASSRRST